MLFEVLMGEGQSCPKCLFPAVAGDVLLCKPCLLSICHGQGLMQSGQSSSLVNIIPLDGITQQLEHSLMTQMKMHLKIDWG